MRFVTYNIQYTRGKDGRFDLGRCVSEVEGADVIALQEVERHWRRTGMEDQPARIADLLGAHHGVYGPYFDVALTGGDVTDARRRQFGNMVLSRHPILSSRVFVLPRTHHPDRFNMWMGALETLIDAPGGALAVWSIHLGYLDPPERLAQIDCLFDRYRSAAAEQGAWSGPGTIGDDDWSDGAPAPPPPVATVWMGDFNMTPDSEEYARITGGGDFLDCWTLAGNPRAAGVSHGIGRSPPAGRRINHCFVSPALAPAVRAAWIDESARGSDHQPVWVELETEREV